MTYDSALQHMQKALCLATMVVTLLGPRVSEAQVLTGSLVGTVRDEQAFVVSGVQVRLTSPAIIGGALTTTTDAKGQLRFPALTDGLYAIEITKPGFSTLRSSDIRITTGSATSLDFVLSVRSMSDKAQVTAARDAGNPGLGAKYGATQLLGMPTPRNGFFGLVGMSPFTSPTSRTTSFMSAAGGGVDHNVVLVDGTNANSASNGVARYEAAMDFAEGIRVQLLPSAEYGSVQGAVIELIMRQGSDRFLWDGSLYAQPAALTSQPILRPINFTGTEMSGYERQHYANATTTLGGPVVRNRAWFFAGYEYLRDQDSQPGADPDFPKTNLQRKMAGKLTWLAAPGWQLMHSIHYESLDFRELPTATKRPEATQHVQTSAPAAALGNLTHVSRANRVWEVGAGRYQWSQDITRNIEGDTPARLDRTTNIASGAPSNVGQLQQIRWTARASLSLSQTNLFGTDHQWKIGGQFDRGQHRSVGGAPTGVRYEDNAPLPTRAFVSGPSNAGGRFNTAAAFVTDEFPIGSRLAVAAGVRFDYMRAISPDLAELDAFGNETGKTIAGDGFLYSWQEFSPRISLALKLTSDGRTIARASFGKFRAGILTGEISPDHPGGASVTQGNVDPVTGNLVNPTTTNSRDNVQISAGTRAPTTDTLSVVVEREIVRTVTASVAYVHKNGKDFIGWSDIRGQYREESMTVNGVTIPKYVLTSAPATRLYELANQPEYSLAYHGFSVMVEKRLSNGWYASGSYTRSQASGLQPSGGATAAGAQVATTGAPPVSFASPVTFGRDPNSETNAGGRLPNDRPNLFRCMAAAELPRTGINVAASIQYSTGKPWATTADIVPSPTQGPTRVLLEARGTQRLSSQTLLDLRVSRTFSIGAAGHVDLRFDVLNLFNDTAEESIASDKYDSPSYNVANVFLDPRRVMLSVRMNLGK